MVRRIIAVSAWSVSLPCFAQDYQVGAGDTVRIDVFDEARLSREALVPTGCRVDMELIGPIAVCGRTPVEIAKDISERLAAGYLVSPNVTVHVTAYGSQKVEVRGSVKEPGIQVLAGPTSLSEVITAAGGPDSVNVVDVQVINQSTGAVTYSLSGLSSSAVPVMVSAGDTVILREGRYVYVDGEVKNDGPVPYHEGITLSQAISSAGGPDLYASKRRVHVLRASSERIVVNLKRVRTGKEADLVLEPDDRVTLLRSYL